MLQYQVYFLYIAFISQDFITRLTISRHEAKISSYLASYQFLKNFGNVSPHMGVDIILREKNVEQTAGRFSISRLYFSEKLFDGWPRASPDIDEVDP